MKNILLFIANISIIYISMVSISQPTLANQACIKNDKGKIICGELVNSVKTTKKVENTSLIRTKAGVDYTLEGCKKSRTGLACTLSMYNSTDYDKTVQVVRWLNGDKSTIIDSEGNEYDATQIVFSNNKEGDAGTLLPPKLKMTVNLFFIPTGKLTDNIRILKVTTYVQGDIRANRTLTFRDIKVN